VAETAARGLTIVDYGVCALLGLVCAGLGIVVMRLVTVTERLMAGWTRNSAWRPVIGGVLMMPIAWLSPQALSAGHGALHLVLITRPSLAALVMIAVLKIAASVICLASGFRGGLFFAS
ncbi:chloride channel protein, partial [Salmonella enterica]|uniref:chloride channel protein n=1 Tax=Salmonella enterica TaxID=28901 RepID=UPI003D2CBAA4